MGVPNSEVGYTSATARRGDHEISYEHVVALEKQYMRWVFNYLHGVKNAWNIAFTHPYVA